MVLFRQLPLLTQQTEARHPQFAEGLSRENNS